MAVLHNDFFITPPTGNIVLAAVSASPMTLQSETLKYTAQVRESLSQPHLVRVTP